METHEEKEKKKESLLELLGPKRAFIFGIIAMFMTVSTIGFFVLLSTGWDGTSSKTFGSTTNTNKTATTNTNANTNADANAPAQVTVGEITADDHIKGDLETADVVVVEYSDMECPFCKQYHPRLEQLSADFGEKVAWVYRHFPLESLHPKAPREAEAAECAGELGGNDGFWAFLDKVYEVTPSNNGLEDSQLPEIAGEVGLDVAKFTECLDSGKYTDTVQAQYQDAVNAGGTGTPYSVIVGKDGTTIPINGAQPYSSVKSAVESLLN